MLEKLKERWNVKSNFQLLIIFIVFAITGSLSAKVAGPFAEWIGVNKEAMPYPIFFILKLIIILPIYKVILIIVGTLFGQFTFFWWFLKKMLRRMLPFAFK